MTEKEMPTLRELMALCGIIKESVHMGSSRTVLKKLDNMVVAYGIGFRSFVAVFKTPRGYLEGVEYNVFAIHTTHPNGCLYPIPYKKALEIIKKHFGFVKKYIDKEELKNIKEETHFERPIYGEIIFETSSESEYKFRIERYKGGQLGLFRKHRYTGKWVRCDKWHRDLYKSFWKSHLTKTPLKPKNWVNSIEFKLTKNTVPKKIIEEYEKQLTIEAI